MAGDQVTIRKGSEIPAKVRGDFAEQCGDEYEVTKKSLLQILKERTIGFPPHLQFLAGLLRARQMKGSQRDIPGKVNNESCQSELELLLFAACRINSCRIGRWQ